MVPAGQRQWVAAAAAVDGGASASCGADHEASALLLLSLLCQAVCSALPVARKLRASLGLCMLACLQCELTKSRC